MSDGKIGRRDMFRTMAAGSMAAGLVGSTLHTGQTADAAAEKVPRKFLGSTGKRIPILLMGGSQRFDPRYDRVLHRAYSEGVNYIDTAQRYAGGQSHSTIGTFIEQVGRKNVWITSKVLLLGLRGSPKGYVSNLEQMLPDLKTDYLDMFFMHNVNDLDRLDSDHIRMAQDLKRRGLIHHFGFSCHRDRVVDLLNKAAELGPEAIDTVMFRYNFTTYGDYELNKAIDACKKSGVGLIAMKTQASVPEDREYVRKFQSDNFTLHQAKLKAVWADERIDAAVSEMTNIQQLQENVAAAKTTTKLSMNEFVDLNRYAAATAHHRCQGCDHICRSKIAADTQVGDILRYLMYDECYGKHEDAHRWFRALAPHERQIDGVDFGAASTACPQGIDIARRLREAQTRLA